MRNIFPLLGILLFAASCAAPVAIINTSPEVDSIQLCASYDQYVNENIIRELDFALDKFILHHNMSDNIIKVKGCRNNDDYQTINLSFGPTAYVGSKQNLLATAGNVVGIVGVPIAMASAGSTLILGFYFWPDTQTPVRVDVSEDLEGAAGAEFPLILKSPGYFNSISKQNVKQGKGLYRILHFWFTTIEKQHVWEQKRNSKFSNQ